MFVATSNEVTVTHLHDGGLLDNSLGFVKYDLIAPHIGNSDAMAAIVAEHGVLLEGTEKLDVEAGDKFVMFLIPDSHKTVAANNVVYSDPEFNFGVHTNGHVDFMREGVAGEQQSAVGVWGFEDWMDGGGDRDYNDTVFRLTEAEFVPII